jgi:hypothetical protein
MPSPAMRRGYTWCWPGRTVPTIVPGHSYDGQIIAALGIDAPNVVGLVDIAAFVRRIDRRLLGQGPPTPALAHLDIDSDGFAWIPRDDFVKHFTADVDPVKPRSCMRCNSRCTPPPGTT